MRILILLLILFAVDIFAEPNLKSSPKPNWVDKKIYMENGYLYSVGISSLSKIEYSKKSADYDANFNLSSFLNLKVRIADETSKNSTDITLNTSTEITFSNVKTMNYWIDKKNKLIYSLVKASIVLINNMNHNIISKDIIEMLKRNTVNKKIKNNSTWIKDSVKIVKIDGKEYYHVVGKNEYLGDLPMTIRASYDDALKKFVLFVKNDGNKKKNKKKYTINIAGALVIETYINPKNKDVYVLMEISKDLFEKFNK